MLIEIGVYMVKEGWKAYIFDIKKSGGSGNLRNKVLSLDFSKEIVCWCVGFMFEESCVKIPYETYLVIHCHVLKKCI